MRQLPIRGLTILAIALSCGGECLAQNAIADENALPGNPPAEWAISGAGDEGIQGFATDISVDQGETIEFKIDTESDDYRIDIYRLGYYAGLGARLVAMVQPSATLPQGQPECIFDNNENARLLDCGNWAVSAAWPVPANATSGIYLARLVREDPPFVGDASHIIFVVRDDDGASDILFQTPDTTWQAYNLYSEGDLCGGYSLYAGPDGKANKLSYNRPFTTRGCVIEDFVFNADYPMVRWLERNGYDVSYSTCIDSDRRGEEILEHQVFVSVGHDEYWSRAQRDAVAAARDAGVHLAFFSGNEVYWKIRWEDSVDGSDTPHRTMVCYKEGTLGENQCGGQCDPSPDTWTGLWRDGCDFSPPEDGCQPENELSGQISWVGSTAAITVPAIYGSLPFWRNTDIATLTPGQTATLGTDTLGYEWDPHQPAYDASAPLMQLWLSSTTVGGQTHHLSLYQALSGALVFGAGTVQWSWGLDSVHDRGSAAPDVRMQQATVNLLADMGVQPGTLQVDLVPCSPPGPDEDPPSVIAHSPAIDATGVPVSTLVTATFNENVAPLTISFTLRDSTADLVSVTLAYSSLTRTATLTPVDALEYNEVYTATVSGAEDTSANAMAAEVEWSFTTGSPPPPPPDEGPGGPILVVADAINPFGRYFAEILRAEGFNYFTVTDISLVTPAVLDEYEVVILAEMLLSGGEVTMLTDWVTAGGKLIAMRPDPQLAGLLGVTPGGGTIAEGYVLVSTAAPPGQGIVGETIQYHSAADLYALAGASSLATLYSNATTPTVNPAVTLRSVGPMGGMAAAFAYDLARSVVYTRQGNPAWSGTERDGVSPIRSDDQFFPDWINLDKVAIPQADEQQRLLANLILHMAGHPWPRFWYLPSFHKAAVIMTGDQHGCCGATAGRFQIYLDQSPPGCSLDDWECVRASSYIYPGGGMTNAEGLAWHNLGFELGIHCDTGCADWTEPQLNAFFTGQLATFAAQFPSLPVQNTERGHCVTWSTWAGQPKAKLQHGIRLDTNYYYWPPGWVQNRPGMFTGSGMPMRFADLDGTMIDVYQAVTQMTDESGQSYPFTIDSLLDQAIGPEGYYGAFCANMHTDSSPHGGSDAIVASAQARGVPVVSGRQMLVWLDGRNASTYSGLDWTGSTLSFTVSVGVGATNLRGMVPASGGAGTLASLTRGGGGVAFSTETIKGIEYAIFDADPGDYVAIYAPDLAPPAISNLAAIPDNDGTAEVTWTTDEPADSLVEYGTDPGALVLSASSATLVTSHSVSLSGLLADTSYYYRVTSADANDNSSTSPAPRATASFTMPGLACAEDLVAQEFAGGSTGSATYVSETDDGEVILAPTEGSEFFGVAMPAGWETVPWAGGGGAVVAGGSVAVDGARINTAALYGPGRSVEFVATFGAANNQHAGFAVDFNAPPWAMFSTMGSTDTLFARTSAGGDISLGVGYVGAPHRYRVDWGAGSITFFIDGTLVSTHGVAMGASMRPIASDFIVGGAAISLNWMRMTPYAASGSFTSRVFDAGTTVDWGAATWAWNDGGTGHIDMFTRTGNTPSPDGSWSPFLLVPTSGSDVGATSQYLQYRADLSTTDTAQTPALEDVTVACTASGGDVTPPTVVLESPSGGATDVARGVNVTATFSEPMNAATIDDTTFTLTPQGGGSPVSASVSYDNGSLTATLDPAALLDFGTTYDARVTTGAQDTSGNGIVGDHAWAFTTVAADLTAPAVTARSPSPAATAVAIGSDVTATFSEPMNAATIGAATFTLSPSGGGGPVSATVSYHGPTTTATLDPDGDLSPSTVYEARVTTGAQDLSGNGLAADDTWTFTTAAPICIASDIYVEFSAGTTGLDTYVARTDDGEVILHPAAGAEFEGAVLDAGWASFNWPGGGSAVLSGGQVTLDAAKVRADGFVVAPRRLEFVATFDAVPFQHVGFGAGGDSPGSDTFSVFPFAIFSTGTGGTALMARVGTAGGSLTEVTISSSFLGAPHLYRLDWNPASFDFHIDGALVQTIAVAVPEAMRPAASDLFFGGPTLSVAWMRMTQYAPSGSYLSEVFDAGTIADWDFMDWMSTAPPGTAVALLARGGNTPAPDGTWTAFAPILDPGDPISFDSRYLQYRADLSTADPDVTPQLLELTIGCTASPDVSPPVISNIVATPAAEGTSATITWDTDEPADTLVVYGTDPGTLSSVEADVALVFAHAIELTGLAADTLYYYRVSSADVLSNSATAPEPPADPSSFTTPQAICLLDDVTDDFGLGTFGPGTYLARTVDGEVTLAPTEGSEFFGAALPASWEAVPWSGGGGATVSGGMLVVDGARASTAAAPAYGPGRSIEFVATFGAAPFQHVGMAVDYNDVPWVMFSTANTSDTLFARSNNTSTTLGTGYVGAPHRYRIQWNASTVEYFIDDVSVVTHTITIPGPLRPAASDFNVGAPTLSVNWIRMTPYAAAGTFQSRIVDAGMSVTWGQTIWNATVPPLTALSISARSGLTPVPDGSWTAYSPIADSGDFAGLTGRYFQYRAELSTSDPAGAVTPALDDLSVSCTPNLAPSASDDQRSVVQGDLVVIDVLANDDDADGVIDPATVTIAVPPAHGSITLINTLTGEVTYDHGGAPIAADSFTYTVRDETGATSNQATVQLAIINEVVLDIALGGVTASLSRCIHFEVFDCQGGSHFFSEPVAFAAGHGTGVRLEVPIGEYVCMTARDPLHSLARGFTFDSGDSIHYTADFTGAKGALVNGNANGDPFIDVLDYGLFSGEWQAVYPPSDCATLPPHADFSGDGSVFTEDFTFIAINFLRQDDPACCPASAPLGADQPVMAISVAELASRGMGRMASADLNGDGWLDVVDMAAFLGGQRPQPPDGGLPGRLAVPQVNGASWFDSQSWSGGAAPDLRTDVRLALTVLIDAKGATAARALIERGGDLQITGGSLQATAVTVRGGGRLTVSGGGAMAAAELIVERGGTLHLTGSETLVRVGSLVLFEGAALLWQGGVLEVDGGTFEQEDLDLVVGGSAGESTLRLVHGAKGHVPSNTLIGGHRAGRGVLEVVCGTFTTGLELVVGHKGAGELWVLESGAVVATEVSIGARGSIGGDGLVRADLVNGGSLRPGNGLGAMAIDGDYRQVRAGTLEIEFGPDAHDVLRVAGAALLSGRLVLVLEDGYLPQAGEEFRVIEAPQVRGRFDEVVVPGLPRGRQWAVRYPADGVILAVTPAQE